MGASGYTGGELLRLLIDHPHVRPVQITSRSLVGQPAHRAHPNLRGHCDLLFTAPTERVACDVVFLCLPHGESAGLVEDFLERARLVVDLSADLRLRDPSAYERWYGRPHPAPSLLGRTVYGLPELTRDALRGASIISGVGCNATAMNFALLPLARAGLIERAICDIKVGSSEAGAEATEASHHPNRSRAVRTYSPAGHRHLGEVEQALGEMPIDATITAIEMVRGVLCTAHVWPTRPLTQKDLWQVFRTAYADEPFVRLVADRTGLHRLPDPKVLAGSNHVDVGFAIDERSGRVIVLSAIDNLMKGAAGSAVQSMNIALGLPETAGLGFPGLNPV
ncbi:MAG: N-acetyl-gamma-glutamyl-phosphate reductase [Phycisphaerales bacterium]